MKLSLGPTARSSHRLNRPRAGRRARRGAALAEAIVVISCMLMFLGLIVFARDAYAAKLDLQQRARSSTLYEASHGCTGEAAAFAQAGVGGFAGAPATEALPPQSAGLTDNLTMNQQWNNVQSTVQPQTVSGQAIFDRNPNKEGNIVWGKEALSTTVSARSSLVCNEKKYDSQFTAWFQFGKDMFASGGGIGGLF